MALSTVTLEWSISDLIQSGLSAVLSITPTAQLSDATDHELISAAVARSVVFGGGTGQLAGIVANDNANILPAGTGYLISVVAQDGQIIVPQFQTQILYSNGATQWLDALAPVPVVATSYQYLPLPSGAARAGYVPVATGSGEGSAWAPNGTGGSGYPASPVVSGTPSAGQVLTATSPTAADWQTPGGGGAVSSVFGRTGAVAAASGDYAVGQVTGAAPLASPALTGSPTAPTQTTGDSSTKLATDAFVATAVATETTRAEAAEALLAPKASPALTGTPTAPTASPLTDDTQLATTAYADAAVAVETSRAETAEALALPLAGGTMSGPIAMGSHKITGLANGSAGSDAAAFGQIPAALPPNGAAGGVLSGTYPNPGFATTPLPESGGTMTGWLAPAVAALSFVGSGTTLVNAALGNAFSLTLTASTTTLGSPSNPVDGQVIRFRITQGTGGSFTLAYGTAYDFGAAGGKVDILGFEYVASISRWCYLGSGLGF